MPLCPSLPPGPLCPGFPCDVDPFHFNSVTELEWDTRHSFPKELNLNLPVYHQLLCCLRYPEDKFCWEKKKRNNNKMTTVSEFHKLIKMDGSFKLVIRFS